MHTGSVQLLVYMTCRHTEHACVAVADLGGGAVGARLPLKSFKLWIFGEFIKYVDYRMTTFQGLARPRLG